MSSKVCKIRTKRMANLERLAKLLGCLNDQHVLGRLQASPALTRPPNKKVVVRQLGDEFTDALWTEGTEAIVLITLARETVFVRFGMLCAAYGRAEFIAAFPSVYDNIEKPLP